jgi:hypothetical protein
VQPAFSCGLTTRITAESALGGNATGVNALRLPAMSPGPPANAAGCRVFITQMSIVSAGKLF